MHRIVRGLGPAYEMGEPVKINNTVHIPSEEPEEKEELVSEEELQRREEEEKAAEEKRFREAVDAETKRILSERGAELEKERADIIEQAKKKAADMTAEAKAATIAVMEKAERECAVLKEQAKKEGYDEGFSDGRAASLEKYSKYIDSAGKLLSEINSRKEAYYISNSDELRETVYTIAEKIVMAELKTDPSVIDNILSEAAKNFRNSDYVKITLAEDGVTERFRTDRRLINEVIPFIPEIEIEFDDEAKEGTIVLDNGSSIVDAGIPTQLEFLKEILRNTRGGEE